MTDKANTHSHYERKNKNERTFNSEEQQDTEYGYFWDSVNEIAKILAKITDGKIDEFTAKRMAVHKRNEIEQIICRA